MANEGGQDRQLPASERKIRKAREQGQVARSRDLGHFAVLAAGGAALVALAQPLAGWLRGLLAQALRFDARALASPDVMLERLVGLGLQMLVLLLGLGLLVTLVAVAAAMGGGGWNFTLQALQPDFTRLNPITGVGRLFSKEQLTQTLKACLLALLLGLIGAFYVRAHLPDFMSLLALALPAALAEAGAQLYGGLALLVGALALFALVDVPLQRFMLLKRLRMSHQEFKEEHKQAEGNPEIKGRIRQRMREMSRRRMMAAVPEADLVVTNPTHYAVALKYDETSMGAPRVVAKGTDLVAQRIRDIAREHQVPVLEAPPLARALHAHAELEREIPAALFAAVAQVLAYVYQLRAALAGQGAMPAAVPEVSVPAELDPLAKAAR
ncbi:flagellar biosynthesis protein FlhB [Azohydromonas caseinilytica]|uniref:Flagellar biosynthetic protein FlhB n=1 Tax=Azohydromonas caseinilytica TaxID=2728836 RepID=A0A848F5M3_9BURK|nr:flagellar biosynthesis protein FlhB [Azohydromonas caseinilytica]NML14894.1 flagellar biosynthesis protein FlhB [Azohydromonas caseinilytica]